MSITSWLRRLTRWRVDLDEEDFQEEIRSHLALAERDRIADGADPETAHFGALKEFGNVTLTTEAARRAWRPRWLDWLRDLLNDARYAVRALRKNPAFSLAVIGVLALGIGLNAAVFTMLKGIALNPIAGVDGAARQAVVVRETGSGRQLGVSYPDYLYLRDHHRGFRDLMGSTVATLGLGRGRGSRSLWGELVTGNYFEVLGVRAALGRMLLPSDEAGPGRLPVVVLSDGLWRRDFAADPHIVGKTLVINDSTLTIVGVADPSFHGTTVVYDVEVFIPITLGPQLGFRFGSRETTPSEILSDRRGSLFYPQGYLRPGTTLATAAEQARALWMQLSRERPMADAGEQLAVVSFWRIPGSAQINLLPTLTILTGMGLMVLVIACANIAGLVLVRGVSRRGEIAVRLALGATRARIVRLLVVENLVLAVPGAALGLLVAAQAIPVLVRYAEALAEPQRLFFNVEVDALVMAFAACTAAASAIVFGFVPALRGSRVDLVSVINEDASPRGAARGRLRGGLVVAQVAVSVLLLVGAGLVTRSLDAARRTNPGFDASHATSVSVDLRQNGYNETGGRAFYRRLLDAVRADPGTESATLTVFEPLNFLPTPAQRLAVEGYVPRRNEDVASLWNAVGPDYFRTLRIPIRAGRPFEDRDDETAAPVAMVNLTLAQRFWGGASKALGQRIRVGEGDWRTVIGVAADVKYLRLDEPARPYVYLPLFQVYRADIILHTRGAAPDEVLVKQARAHVEALDANLPVLYAKTLAGRTEGALIFFKLAATMLSVFGMAGMALAAMGTYGLVSYVVRQSTHEIGIRIALGASSGAIVRTFLGRGLWLGASGAAFGLLVSLAATRLLGSVLFGTSATDAVSFARALVIVLGSVAGATVVPAWRAARTNPLAALRHQ